MAKHKIIIDCDPGVDDAVAIFLALHSPEEIELAGITTVAGNVSIERTTANALRICELAGVGDVGVYRGCEWPILPHPKRRGSVHGTDGLGDVGLPNASIKARSSHAVDFIIETVMAHPHEITLCPVGPLTNIALALRKEPRIANALKEIVLMGGAAFCPGNTTPEAEFNVWFDPIAAEVVFSSTCKITMFGLDVTNKAIITSSRLEELRATGSKVATAAAAMLQAYGSGDPALHDPCVIAWLIDHTLFAGIEAHVEVDCSTSLSRARTVAAVSDRHLAGRPPNCTVITDVDNDRLFDLLHTRLSNAPHSKS